jgi:hypothetical protein
MNRFAVYLGVAATAHYLAWPYVPGAVGDGPAAPPLGSVITSVSTGSVSIVNSGVIINTPTRFDTTTDVERDVVAPDQQRQLTPRST